MPPLKVACGGPMWIATFSPSMSAWPVQNNDFNCRTSVVSRGNESFVPALFE